MDVYTAFPVPQFPIFLRPPHTSIPLRCSICTSRPEFSDTSHLLTHIASKAHLSTYYRVKVRSVSDRAARQLIDDYDAWYAAWDIEGLMSNRMTLKEKKSRQKASQSSEPEPSTHRTRQDYGPNRSFPATLVDPALQSPSKQSDTYIITNQHYDQPAFPSIYDHPFTPWQHNPSPSHFLRNQFGYSNHEQDVPEADDEHFPPAYCSPTPAARTYQLGLRTPSILRDEDPATQADAQQLEAIKLKGVLWPGMDIFDSATPEMRRMRNQKKSNDVIDRLKAASREIEATETVYSARGVVEREHVITGFPHIDSSPDMLPLSLSPLLKREREVHRPATRQAVVARGSSSRPRGGIRRTRSDGPRGSRKPAGQVVQRPPTRKTTKARRGRKSAARFVDSKSATLDQPMPIQYLTAGYDGITHSGSAEHNAQPFVVHPPFQPATVWPQAVEIRHTHHDGPWDFLRQQLGGFLANPLYMGDSVLGSPYTEDDQLTLSAPASDI